jgi:hypothetical protein
MTSPPSCIPYGIAVSDNSKEYLKKRVKVETLNVQRARELLDIYEGLMIDEESGNKASGGRIEQLFSMKKIASQHTCPASSSLEKLIDQELFLLSSRVNSPILTHLRSRIRLGFLRLARGSLQHDNRMKVVDPEILLQFDSRRDRCRSQLIAF